MYTIREYVWPDSVETAARLNQKKQTTLLAGGIWTRLGQRRIGTAVDLSGLNLAGIRQTDEGFEIGAMTPLRAVECHSVLAAVYGSLFKDALSGIVGVQLRNAATVGGSVWARFGFSDVIAALLTIDADVLLFEGGRLPLADFLSRSRRQRDLLLSVILKPTVTRAVFHTFRLEAADIPTLNCGVSRLPDGGLRAVVGARPAIAQATILSAGDAGASPDTAALGRMLAGRFRYGSNLRGSAEYRKHLAGVLLGRCLEALLNQEEVRHAD